MTPGNQILASGATITVVHYFGEVVGFGHRIACMPFLKDFHAVGQPMYQRTDDPRAANCPACKKSPAYVAAMGGR